MQDLDGVVCSVLEAKKIAEACGNEFLRVTPGIRLAEGEAHDQVRVATPANARILGSSHIVVGRAITKAENPVEAYQNNLKYVGGTRMTLENKIAKALLKVGAVELKPNDLFTWASGIKSPIYCDNRITMSSPAIRKEIAKGLAKAIEKNFPGTEAVAGTATAGIPHAAWVSDVLEIPMMYVRSKAKEHGRGNQIEGKVVAGQKVVVIEDLISTGGSSLVAVEALQKEGLEVLGVVSIFLMVFQKRNKHLKKQAFHLSA